MRELHGNSEHARRYGNSSLTLRLAPLSRRTNFNHGLGTIRIIAARLNAKGVASLFLPGPTASPEAPEIILSKFPPLFLAWTIPGAPRPGIAIQGPLGPGLLPTEEEREEICWGLWRAPFRPGSAREPRPKDSLLPRAPRPGIASVGGRAGGKLLGITV